MLVNVSVETEFETERVGRYRVGKIGCVREETRHVWVGECVFASVCVSYPGRLILASVLSNLAAENFS